VSFVATASECASVTTPDIAHRPDVPRQSRQAIIPLGGFVRSRAVAAFIKMTSSSARRGPKLRKPKPSVTPGDLARRFLEVVALEINFAGRGMIMCAAMIAAKFFAVF
jgi:hypothetical protein